MADSLLFTLKYCTYQRLDLQALFTTIKSCFGFWFQHSHQLIYFPLNSFTANGPYTLLYAVQMFLLKNMLCYQLYLEATLLILRIQDICITMNTSSILLYFHCEFPTVLSTMYSTHSHYGG
jgi:hypothetical protein